MKECVLDTFLLCQGWKCVSDTLFKDQGFTYILIFHWYSRDLSKASFGPTVCLGSRNACLWKVRIIDFYVLSNDECLTSDIDKLMAVYVIWKKASKTPILRELLKIFKVNKLLIITAQVCAFCEFQVGSRTSRYAGAVHEQT